MAEMARQAFKGRAVIYGGKGALGNACVSYFKSKSWWVGSVDMNCNGDAHSNVVVKPRESWIDQETDVLSGVKDMLNDEKIDVLICVAGGWAGGNAASKDFIKNADLMWKQSVWTSVIAANIAAEYLKDGGFLSLTGAKAALGGTPGMIGYGLAKSSVHHLVKSLAEPKSGLPAGARVVGILPVTLDTPMNRKFMPTADFSSWTPLSYVAELLYTWGAESCQYPSGSLLQLVTEKGNTTVLV